MKTIFVVCAFAVWVGGCANQIVAPFDQNLELARGPAAEITHATPVGALACVAAKIKDRKQELAEEDRRRVFRGERPKGVQLPTFGVLSFPDLTGAVNQTGNDSFGSFNTLGASNMLHSSLMRAGVPVIEMDEQYRRWVEWTFRFAGQTVNAKSTEQVVPPAQAGGPSTKFTSNTNNALSKTPMIGLRGGITTHDFLPGGGTQGGAFGLLAGYNQNRILTSLDLSAMQMPRGNRPGGDMLAHSTVTKQVSQEGGSLQLTRYMGPLSGPTLANFEIGGGRREGTKYSTREMIDVATANMLSKVLGIYGCMEDDHINASH